MTDFFYTHKAAIIYTISVISIVLLLLFLSNLFSKWLIKKFKNKFPSEKPSHIILIKRVLRILWIILGVAAISFIFIDKAYYEVAKSNFYIILYIGIIAIATIITASSANAYFRGSINKKQTANADFTSDKFLRNLVIVSIYFIGTILAILVLPSMRSIAQTALGGAGVIAVIAGVASQEALANLVGGIFIITFKPFKIGHIIKLDESMIGTVTDITLRHTIIRNYENKMIVIPNAIINKETLINYDLGEEVCCQWIEIGISYDSDIDRAKQIMREECETHPLLIDRRDELQKYNKIDKVLVRVIKLDDSAVVIRAWAWAKNYADSFIMKCDLFESIKKRFDKEGIEIPFPHRTLVFKEEQNSNQNPISSKTNN